MRITSMEVIDAVRICFSYSCMKEEYGETLFWIKDSNHQIKAKVAVMKVNFQQFTVTHFRAVS
jgi:cephalosporin hydroxylase